MPDFQGLKGLQGLQGLQHGVKTGFKLEVLKKQKSGDNLTILGHYGQKIEIRGFKNRPNLAVFGRFLKNFLIFTVFVLSKLKTEKKYIS